MSTTIMETEFKAGDQVRLVSLKNLNDRCSWLSSDYTLNKVYTVEELKPMKGYPDEILVKTDSGNRSWYCPVPAFEKVSPEPQKLEFKAGGKARCTNLTLGYGWDDVSRFIIKNKVYTIDKVDLGDKTLRLIDDKAEVYWAPTAWFEPVAEESILTESTTLKTSIPMSFNRGDIVRCVATECDHAYSHNLIHYNKGGIYPVLDTDSKDNTLSLLTKAGGQNWVPQEAFELYVPEESPATGQYSVSEAFIREAYSAACKSWQKKIAAQFPELFPSAESIIKKLGPVFEDHHAGIYEASGIRHVQIPLPVINTRWSLAAFDWAKRFLEEVNKAGLDGYYSGYYLTHRDELPTNYIHIRIPS